MRPTTKTLQLPAASANAIVLSQAGTAATALTLNGALVSGGIATLATPARITITSSANDSATTFVIVGTTPEGWTISESLLGGNAVAVTSVNTFSTITSITPSQNTVGNITAGNAASGSTQWIPLDIYSPSPAISASVVVSAGGAVNYTVEYTESDVWAGTPCTPFNWPSANLVAAGTNQSASNSSATQSHIPMRAARLTINSGLGSAALTLTQQSLA